jgi:hypothetical protein
VRIKTIELEWFRGAADRIALDPDCKSLVIYGANGSGKSSFVDGFEYLMHKGKIGHLSHEYSGRHQEKAIPNTHKPADVTTGVRIRFKNDSKLEAKINEDGSFTTLESHSAAVATWDYRRTILRQDEVSSFIHDTKGNKYSALLSLLGLGRMEVAAENLRQLAKSIENEANLQRKRITLRQIAETRKTVFGMQSDDEIFNTIERLHTCYCADNPATKDTLSRCIELEAAVDARMAQSSAEQRRHFIIQTLAELDLKAQISAVRAYSLRLASEAEPLVTEKLDVLLRAVPFVDKLEDTKKVNCPACGRSIPAAEFRAHIAAERERLQEIINIFNDRKAALGLLCNTVNTLKNNLGKPELKSWRDGVAMGDLARNLAYADGSNAETLRASCNEGDLIGLEDNLLAVVAAVADASRDVPPDARALSTAKRTTEAARGLLKANNQAVALQQADALIALINSLEQGARDEIRRRSQAVIDDISSDIQRMWEILHPGEAIEGVSLYLSGNIDKAIDIRLKFYGVEQDSPRLTLSEGYRNSLGLCIFLALAKQDAESDRPLFLDDVVVSLDRNHRGMIQDLLVKEFDARQVIVLTHDREWYAELRQQLDAKHWGFKVLLPWESPAIGIRWSHNTTTFDDARAHVASRPDSAGNDARKIMDVELALIGERLRMRLPYLRGDKNDKRLAHEFLERLIADGKTSFKKRKEMGADYLEHGDAITAWENADRLLSSWANRASHSFNLVGPEAIKLIDACESALEFFKCSACGKNVWFAETGKSFQCGCGQIRWK